MIGSNKNTEINNQLVQIAINTRDRGSAVDPAALPFDPANASDTTTDIIVIAQNWIDNSDFDWSKDGYNNNPLLGGDVAYECYNFYRQRFIKLTDLVTTATSTAVTSAAGKFKATYTYPMDFVLLNGKADGSALSGTLTRVDDNNATLSVAADNTLTDAVLYFGTALAETAANALKSSGHSLYAANEGALDIIPRWDNTNGWGEMGSDIAEDSFDIATPLPLNFIRGGITYYFQVLLTQRAGTTSGSPVRLYAGIWDATSTQKRFLESSNLDLTASTVGTAGGTTYNYVVIADLDDGTSIVSDVFVLATGNAVLSASNYNRLTWQNAVGVLNFRIYRSVGGVVKRIFTIRNGGHDYNDFGTDEGETPVALPTAAVVRPVVYKVSSAFDLASPGAWSLCRITLEIPSTYDTSLTTDKQWLRFGIEGETGTERLILFDRVGLSSSDGGWQRSARDFDKILNQNPSANPTSTTQGGVGGCFTLDTPVLVCEQDGSNKRFIPIGETDAGMFVFSGGNRVYRINHKPKDTVSEKIIN